MKSTLDSARRAQIIGVNMSESEELEELEGALQEMEGHVLRVEALSAGQRSEELAERVEEMLARLKRLGDTLKGEGRPSPVAASPSPSRTPDSNAGRPASRTRIEPLLQPLRELVRIVSSLSLDPTDEAAIRRWLEYFEAEPQPGAAPLGALIELLDSVSWDYGMYAIPDTRRACDGLLARACALLHEMGGEAFPLPGFSGPMLTLAKQKGFEVQRLLAPSPVGAGEVAHVVRRGVRLPGREPSNLIVAVSSGHWNDALDAVDVAVRSLLHINGLAVKDLRRLLWKLADAEGDRETTMLRMAVNRIWDFTEPETAVPKKKLLSALDARGVKPMWIPTGSPLDDSFSSSLFQSTPVPSDAPANTVVRVIRPGFLDTNGLPVQKALLGISTGRPEA